MSEQHGSQSTSQTGSNDDRTSALFAQLVLQQTNMAMMLMGKIAHPESGQVYKDVEAARLFIDQLEMLETKTRGNLSKDESGLLKQSLMNLRLAFVEAVESDDGKKDAQPQESKATAQKQAEPEAPASATGASGEDEHRKKFSKKY